MDTSTDSRAGEIALHVDQLDRDGYTILEDAFDADVATALYDDVLRLERSCTSSRPATASKGGAPPGCTTCSRTVSCTSRSRSIRSSCR